MRGRRHLGGNVTSVAPGGGVAFGVFVFREGVGRGERLGSRLFCLTYLHSFFLRSHMLKAVLSCVQSLYSLS